MTKWLDDGLNMQLENNSLSLQNNTMMCFLAVTSPINLLQLQQTGLCFLTNQGR